MSIFASLLTYAILDLLDKIQIFHIYIYSESISRNCTSPVNQSSSCDYRVQAGRASLVSPPCRLRDLSSASRGESADVLDEVRVRWVEQEAGEGLGDAPAADRSSPAPSSRPC